MEGQQTIERVPDAEAIKRRRSALARVLASLFGWGLVAAVAVVAVMAWGWTRFIAEGPLAEAKTMILPEGASRSEISGMLEKEGVISDARVFNGAAILWGFWGKTLKSGEYEFLPGATMANVMEVMAAGRVVTYKLTIPEGWTSQMALARINGNEILSGDAVPASEVPEGAIVADTAVFRRGMTRAKLVKDMMAAQADTVEDVWARRPADSPVKSKEQLVVLASIVEKETGVPEERPRVAAVFLNRLKQGMRLQSDPTIIYGIAGGKGKLERPLTRADIEAATPYNTYQIDGLPPGPIAIPGKAALEAVVEPAKTEDLYFVADGTGGHAFAKTLEEHNANVANWRAQELLTNQDPGAGTAPGQSQSKAQTGPAQPPLPAPEVTANSPPPAAGTEDAAIAEAAQTQKEAQPVPAPASETAAAATGAPPKTVAPPRPVEKKPKLASSLTDAGTAAGDAAVKFVPGTVVEIDGRKIPVPLIKQKKKL